MEKNAHFCLAYCDLITLHALVQFSVKQQICHSEVIIIITTNPHYIKTSLHSTKLQWTTLSHSR